MTRYIDLRLNECRLKKNDYLKDITILRDNGNTHS